MATFDTEEVVALRRKLRHQTDEIEAMKRVADREARRLEQQAADQEKPPSEQRADEDGARNDERNDDTRSLRSEKSAKSSKSVRSVTESVVSSLASEVHSAFLFEDDSEEGRDARAERHARREERRRKREEKEERRRRREDRDQRRKELVGVVGGDVVVGEDPSELKDAGGLSGIGLMGWATG